MKQIIFVLSLILSFSVAVHSQQHHPGDGSSKFSIEEPSNAWILALVDSLRNTTSICGNCMSPPTIKRYVNQDGKTLYRLRYACDDVSSFINIYDSQGNTVATCQIDGQVDDCDDFEAYTDFTFTKSLMHVWSCREGFNCDAKDSLGLFQDYAIITSGSECKDKIRELSISTPFNEYEWKGASGNISYKSNIMADRSGMYAISVMDGDGCKKSKSQEVHVFEEKAIPIEGDRILCPGEITYLSSHGYASYLWSTGDTTDHIVVADAANIGVTVTDILGCTDSTIFDVQKVSDRSIEIKVTEDLFYTDQVIPIHLGLSGFSSNDIKDILWTSEGELTCEDCPSLYGKFSDDSDISVMVTDKNDCIHEHSVKVKPVQAYKELYTPNIFTPDGDGENDLFIIRGQQGSAIVHSFKVFNRWGVPIHEAGRHQINDESMAWDGYLDGAILETGVYVYMAEVEFVDKTKKYITGDILLVR